MKIIKIISMFFLLIGLASFDSIQPVLDLKYNSIARKQDKPTLKKVKVRLRWHGIGGPGNACWKTNRDCGDCPGLCVLIEFRLGNITQQEKDDGDGYVDLTLDGNSLIFEPEASVDDGRGKVTITEDYFIGSAVSGLLGKNRVIIKAGDFDIDYKQGLGFGRVVFNAITE